MTSFGEILRETRRLPFSKHEIQRMNDVLAQDQRSGGDLRWGASHRISASHNFPDDEEDLNAAADGLIVLSSPARLEQVILFVKVDGGRTFLGRQKALYYSFVTPFDDSDPDRDWMSGAAFNSWRLATKAIAHIGPIAKHLQPGTST